MAEEARKTLVPSATAREALGGINCEKLGHDHSLQVIRASSDRPWYLVSGSGAKQTGLDASGFLECAHAGLGFMVMRSYADRSVTVDLNGLDASS